MQKSPVAPSAPAEVVVLPVVLALSFSHLLNDMMQSLLPAIYPLIKSAYGLDFGQIGMITLAFQLTASMLQPFVGLYTDNHPWPYSTVAGMAMTMLGLVVLAKAGSFAVLLGGAALVGTGSSIFHPEATRMARAASGGRYGFAQSVFQVGGQTGQAIGPLLAAFIVVPGGQSSLLWFCAAALLAMVVLSQVDGWYRRHAKATLTANRTPAATQSRALPRTVWLSAAIILILMLSKSAYTSSISNFLIFYLIEKFSVSVRNAQLLLFAFLLAQVVGSLIGGHLSDRVGRRRMIWFSVLGALPFTSAVPYVGLVPAVGLLMLAAMIMASAFPAMLVYILEQLPGRVGVVSGLFFGAAFGLGGMSAALLGHVADWTSLVTVFQFCALLPLVGLATWFLPVPERAVD